MPGHGIRDYRGALGLSQADLAEALGVSQAYVSQLESGARPISRKLAAKLAALPAVEQLPPTVFPEDFDAHDTAAGDLGVDLAALGYPGFSAPAGPAAAGVPTAGLADSQPARAGASATTSVPAPRGPRNPAAVVLSILRRQHVAPAITAAVPWVLLTFPALNTRWLIDQARMHNLQNRLGFLTDLAYGIAESRHAAGRFDADHLAALAALRAELEDSRLVKEDTLARVLTPAERQFFHEHRSELARHWNLLTGLTKEQLPYTTR